MTKRLLEHHIAYLRTHLLEQRQWEQDTLDVFLARFAEIEFARNEFFQSLADALEPKTDHQPSASKSREDLDREFRSQYPNNGGRVQ